MHCTAAFFCVLLLQRLLCSAGITGIIGIILSGSLMLRFMDCMLLQTKSTMQPGSKGGYYTEKSPKMLLLEWCQQQKRPKPRYKVLAAAADTMRCKVSLFNRHVHKSIVHCCCSSLLFTHVALQLDPVRPGIDGFSGSEMWRPAWKATLVFFVPTLQGTVPVSAWWDVWLRAHYQLSCNETGSATR